MRKQALLLILICFYIQINAQNWHQEQKIVASDRAVEDQFGISVSINGDYALVGAWMEDHDVLGGNLSSSSGSAYIYKLDGNGNWNQIQKLVASDRSNDDHFGFSVSIYGNYAIVSALREDNNVSGGSLKSNSGSAYIFKKNSSGVWSQVQKIVASDRDDGDEFGHSVSICGNYALIGAWHEDHDINGSNTYSASGSAYIFERGSSGTWNQVQKIVASDRAVNDMFGRSVSISGNYIIVGAFQEDEDSIGLNYLNGAGSAYIFEKDSNGIWNQKQKLVAVDRGATDHFGFSVSIDSNKIIIGAFNEDEDPLGANTISDAGSTYVFERNSNGIWNQVQKIVASDRGQDANFGNSVAINNDKIIVGAYADDKNMTGGNLQNASGSAYIFEKNLYGIWNQEQKIVAFDRCQADWFGFSVSISGNYAISGAVHEDNDVLYSNFMNNSGSAYIYRSCKTNSVITPTTCNQYVSPSGNYVWSNSGIYIDTIPNALGCDSIITVNLTINSNTSDTTTVSACYNYISPSGNYNWNKSGIYNDTIQNSSGCDSLITIYLTIDTVDVSVTQTGITLTANSSNATYQWLDCYNGSSIIPGANNQSYTPDSIGVYAVEITKNGCIDTSSCIVVIGIGIIENDLSHSLNIYPNPTSCELIVEVKNIEKLEIMSINGKSILCFNTKKDRLNIDLSTYKKGIYFIKVTTIDHVFVRKVEVN